MKPRQNETIDPVESTLTPSRIGEVANTHLPRSMLPVRYEDLGEIAGGSFGEVRRVRDTVLDRIIAMKLLRVEHADVSHIRRRFLVEAQITAQLQHPGIVAIYDRGELPDGRLWFTMKEIRGRTLWEVIDEVHAAKTPDGFGPTASGWTFRRLVDAFARISQAVAYAHNQNVVHRDLKPDNLMVGEFGEVLVMDWGLARRAGVHEAVEETGHQVAHDEPSAALTQYGDILGTPSYMPPEQAQGDTTLHGPRSDVYSLGAVLYCVLSGRPPFTEHKTGRAVLAALALGPPLPIAQASREGPPLPAELCAICERAMRRDMVARYENAAALADDVVAWLDGVRLREQALEALQQARVYEPEIAQLRSEANRLQTQARALQNDVRPADPVEKKVPVWNLEDDAKRLGRMAALAETKWLEAVHGSLSVDPRLPEAHALLADHYRARLVEAEREHRDEDAARAEELLRIHDRGKHAAFLRGKGRLSLVTDPPGADVFVDRYVLQNRRLVAMPEGHLGQTPLVEVELERGSYLLRIRAPGKTEVRYPVLIERDGVWDGIAPGESEPSPIYLPNEAELGADEVYVPAGYAWTGGDPDAPDGLPGRRIWMDAFVIGKYPVTNAEYLAFLNELVERGREVEALEACPRAQHGMVPDADAVLAYARDAQGRFHLRHDDPGTIWRLRAPVTLVSWQSAIRYTQWMQERTGRAYRLPHELEREKSVRGVDARYFSWGNHFDASWACVIASQGETAGCVDVSEYPTDESPYGMRGGCGNARDFCSNLWSVEGPTLRAGRLVIDPAPTDEHDYRTCRGGAWSSVENLCRAATRLVVRPTHRRNTAGFRWAWSFIDSPLTARPRLHDRYTRR